MYIGFLVNVNEDLSGEIHLCVMDVVITTTLLNPNQSLERGRHVLECYLFTHITAAIDARLHYTLHLF